MAGSDPELIAYLNGDLLPHSEAVAGMRSDGSGSGGGLYDAERTFDGRVFKLREHLQRLYNGLEGGHIDPGLTLDEMEDATLSVIEANIERRQPGDEFVVGQVVSTGPSSMTNGAPLVDVLIYCQTLDFADFARSYSSGVRVFTPATYNPPARRQSRGPQVPDDDVWALKTDQQGYVTECTRANFMFVSDGRIMVPDRSAVLPGISMATVLELAESLGIPVEEGRYNTSDVYAAEGAYISGTRYCMLPVSTINGVAVPAPVPSEVTSRLIDAWSEMVGLDIVQQALDHI
jgi:branched-chain amino acid aminotransferase